MNFKNIFTFSKPDISVTLQQILVWLYLNVALNLIGLWIVKILAGSEFEHLQNIFNEFIKPLIIQTLIFTVCIFAGHTFLKNKKLSVYLFVLIQFLLFNLIFLFNLKSGENGIHFETTLNNPGLHYFSYNGQYLVDIINYIKPLKGEFEEIFKPASYSMFYLYWVILINVYFLALSFFSQLAYKFLKK